MDERFTTGIVSQPVRLLCTVRHCRLPLVREERRLVCANRHSFDVARSGYVNLLQPQDKRSKNPGDTVRNRARGSSSPGR